MNELSNKELKNKFVSEFAILSGFTQSWLLFLSDPKFDDEPEFRNRIFVILIDGLFDSIWEYENRLDTYKKQSKKREIKSILFLYSSS